MPKRIQRKRTKGWRMLENTIYVGRPTRYANYADWRKMGRAEATKDFRRQLDGWKQDAPEDFQQMLDELRGKNLACWCPLDQPCHADILLELANAERELKVLGSKMEPQKRWDCFVGAIQTGVIVEAIQGGHPAGWASDIVIEAMVIPPEEFPDDLAEIGRMATEFIRSLIQDEPYPEWYKDEWIGDEW